MNILLFAIALIISFVVVRLGAIAFELTGLDWSLAKFQALSCFTGTGFTTKESELITRNPQRRRIASFLIVLGHAGFVTLIATFANTLRPEAIIPNLYIPFVHLDVPHKLYPFINLCVIVIIVLGTYRIFTHSGLIKKLTPTLRKMILKREIIRSVSFEELVISTGGYGISQIEIDENNPLLNTSIMDSDLKKSDILVLAIERKGETMPNPHPHTKIELGDRFICFGKLENIRNRLCDVGVKAKK